MDRVDTEHAQPHTINKMTKTSMASVMVVLIIPLFDTVKEVKDLYWHNLMTCITKPRLVVNMVLCRPTSSLVPTARISCGSYGNWPYQSATYGSTLWPTDFMHLI